MKKTNATLHQRPDGAWEAKVTISNEKYLLYGKTKPALQKQVIALLSGIKKPEEPLPHETARKARDNSKMTVERWLTEWQSKWLTNITVNAVRRYSVDIRLHILPYIGTKILSELNPSDIQDMYNAAIANGLSTKSVKCIHSVLHSSLDKAVELGLIDHNATDMCVLPKLRVNEMHPLKDDYVRSFLKIIEQYKYRDAYYIALFTGLRESELLGLTWDCIDFMNNTIHIYRQLQRTHVNGEYAFTQTKNGKSRTIIAVKSVMDILSTILRKQMESKNNPSACFSNPEGFILTDSNGKHLTINSLYKPFKKIVTDMGIPETRFHDLRHSYAVLSLQSGCDIKTLSSNLGHSTIALTLDRYGHVSDTMKKQGSELLENLIQKL